MFRVLVVGLLLVSCSENQQVKQEQEQQLEQQELNLSRDALSEVLNEEGGPVKDSEARLPDLFADEPEDKKTKFSGKVLTKEEAADLRSTVDGVQVEIEVPTR